MTFVTWLDTELEKRNWTRAELSRVAGISHSSLSHIYQGRRNPGSDVCEAIANALKISPENVFQQAGLLPQKPATDDLIEQILYELGGTPTSEKEDVLEYIRLRKQIAERRAKYS